MLSICTRACLCNRTRQMFTMMANFNWCQGAVSRDGRTQRVQTCMHTLAHTFTGMRLFEHANMHMRLDTAAQRTHPCTVLRECAGITTNATDHGRECMAMCAIQRQKEKGERERASQPRSPHE